MSRPVAELKSAPGGSAVQGDIFDSFPAAEELPRRIILASAGSGKTFQISSAIISLLAKGSRPDECFASTFTRKAAGEILDRVLLRIAAAGLDAQEAGELAGHTGIDPSVATADYWCDLLERTVRDLHRMNIGTLDAFFVRTAQSFVHELGMPTRWTIADETTGDRIRSLALQDVLERTDRDVLLDIVRGIGRSVAERSVHDRLLREVRLLMTIHHALDPRVDGHWSAFEELATARPVSEHERDQLAARVAAVERPVTRQGTPNRTWANALRDLETRIRLGRWAEVMDMTIVTGLLDTGTFAKLPATPGMSALIGDVVAFARRDVAGRLHARSVALERLSHLFAEAIERRRAEHGAYEFDDITRLLGGPDPVGERPDMYYRLDMRAKHILLDEFQDTSLQQWEALEPIVDELMSGHRTERAAVVVADPKQSIYGWRGGSPDLVDFVSERYELEPMGLHASWRSSDVVLRFVDGVFGDLPDSTLWGDDELCRTVAGEWSRHYQPHVAQKDLAGHVSILVGPDDEGNSEQRPKLMRRAAEHVAELHARMPAASIAVLTRTNAAVARIMLELGSLGVRASEEGGNPLTDAAPVAAVLALLRLADHPGNTVVRYHVARSPLGEVVGYTDYTDERAALKLSQHVRARLLEDGYGAVVTEYAQKLRPWADARERRRLGQLGELAFRYEPGATLRPTDFVNFIRRERVEDPSSAQVRVMTVHQAKGLEFDIVVLPQLDVDLVDMRYVPLLAYRPQRGARITRAFPYVKKALRGLFPELDELQSAYEDTQRNVLRDTLSSLYVALTRARHALHIVMKPDRNSSTRKTAAALVRNAVCPGATAVEGAVLFESGDADWYVKSQQDPACDDVQDGAETSTRRAVQPLRLREDARRTRSLPRRVPSELEGGSRIEVANLLRLSASTATRRGSVVHRWMEEVTWLDEGVPSDAELTSLAREVDPTVPDEEVAMLLHDFTRWISVPAIREVLSRPDGIWSVLHEVPFLMQDDGAVIEGFIDRVEVRTDDAGTPVAARVLDYKTDALDDDARIPDRVRHYAPQLNAYRRAVARMFRLAPTAVDAALVFLEPGAVMPVPGAAD